MTNETIQFEPGSIARITLNRPDRLNSFTRAMHAELREAMAEARNARVIVITGAGRGFCAGQDLNDRAVAPGEAVDLGETVEVSWNPLVKLLAERAPADHRPRQRRRGGRRRQPRARLRPRRRRPFRQVHPELRRHRPRSRHRRQLAPDAASRPSPSHGPRADRRAVDRGAGRRLGPHLAMRRRRALDATVDALAEKLAAMPPLGLAAIKQMMRTSWDRS